MRWILRTALHVLGNAGALGLAARLIPGVTVVEDLPTLLTLGALLTALNILIRPLLKLFLGPLILLTFGLFLVVVHVIVLMILDFVSPNLTLEGYLALIGTTLLVGVVNLVAAVVGRAVIGRNG